VAVANRRKVDVEIAALFRDPDIDEGTISKQAGEFKGSVEFGITRKADTNALRSKWKDLPLTVQAAFRWKAEVATKEYKALSDEDKAIAIEFVESKPASPSVKVELI